MTFILRKVLIAISFFVVLGIALPQVPSLRLYIEPVIGVEDASAQTKKKRKTLFDILFKRRKKKKNKRIKVISKKKKAAKKKTQKARAKSKRKKRKKVTPPKVLVVKNENASKVLVVGDYISGDLARGLIRRYAENPNIVVVKANKDASGLIREDVTNWPEHLPKLIEDSKPAALVVLIGMNDRQKMRVEGEWKSTLSEEWLAEYNARVQKIIDVSKTANIPLVWVGTPPVPFAKMNPDYLAFNEIYRSKVEAATSTYVDVWDGYTNAEGKYVRAGPDINGQIVRLRTQKGVSMTRAGGNKLAFFADIALRKIGIVQDVIDQKFASLGTININSAQPAAPEYNPIATGKTIIIPLGSASSDGGITLEGEKNFIADDENKKSVSYDLVNKGIINLPQSGRIDANWGLPIKPKEVEKKLEAKEPAKSQQSSNTNTTQGAVVN